MKKQPLKYRIFLYDHANTELDGLLYQKMNRAIIKDKVL